MRGVAEQHQVPRVPAIGPQGPEPRPARGVRQQRGAVEPVREQLLDELDRRQVALARPRIAGAAVAEELLPSRFRGLHHDRRGPVGIGVAVQLHDAAGGLHDVEGERGQDAVGAEPHVPAAPGRDARAEVRRARRPDRGVHPVRRDDQVVIGLQDRRVRAPRAVVHGDPEFRAAALEHAQQLPPADRGEPVPARGGHGPAVVHVDVVPARHPLRHRGEHGGVRLLDPTEGLVGEHDAEAERVVRGVLLPHRDVVRAELRQQGGQVEAARSAARDRDPHARHLRPPRGARTAATSRCCCAAARRRSGCGAGTCTGRSRPSRTPATRRRWPFPPAAARRGR